MERAPNMRAIEGGRAASPRPRARDVARGRITHRTVGDVMVRDVVTVEPAASLAEAARLMETHNVGMLPVVEEGRIKGVITDRDIVVRAIAREADPRTTRVSECLSAAVLCASPEWSTDEAITVMAGAQVGRLPVADQDDRLVGVVTLSSMAFRAPDKQQALAAAQQVSRRSSRAEAY